MYKLNVIASIIVIASANGPQRAYSSACGSEPNTLYSWEISFSDLAGTKLDGEAGVWIYDESDGPDIDVGQGTVSGKIGKENVRLTLRRGDKILGTLTLKACPLTSGCPRPHPVGHVLIFGSRCGVGCRA